MGRVARLLQASCLCSVSPAKILAHATRSSREKEMFQLFTISMTQGGPVCGWYLKASLNDDAWILVDDSDVPTFGDGAGSYSIAAGDIPEGSVIPRNGFVEAFAEVNDDLVGQISIEQTLDR